MATESTNTSLALEVEVLPRDPDTVSDLVHDSPRQYPDTQSGATLGFFEKPHTLTLLAVALVVFGYLGLTRTGYDSVGNTQAGLIAGGAIFLVFCTLQLRDGLFYRPHPMFWRLVQGVAILYLVFLVYLLFQNDHDARQIWTHIDPTLGKPLPERDYGADCRLYTPDDPESNFRNLRDTIYDEFMLAHIIGWFGKSFLYRDVYVCWAWSILFEFCEITFSGLLPNFRECWWDQILLDVLFCNAIGIYLGHYLMYKLQVPTFNWAGIKEKTRPNKILQALVPYDLREFKWQVLESPKRFFAMFFLLFLSAVIELNCFFLKYVLWHPPNNLLVLYRLILHYFFCLPALAEYYEFVANENATKVGTMFWITCAILGLETLVWIKFSKEMFENASPTPLWIKLAWGISLSVITIAACIWFFVIKPKRDAAKLAQEKKDK